MTGVMRFTWPARIGAILLLIVYGTPLYWLVSTSFKSANDVYKGLATFVTFSPTLAAYQKIWTANLLHAGTNSVLIAAGTTAVTLAFAVPAAYALARLRGAVVATGLGLVIVLQMLPQTATVIPLYQVLGSWSLLGSIPGVVLADAALLLPFCILILRPFFLAIPIEIEEAATVDGASAWRVFVRIALPLAFNGTVTAGIIIFLIAWGEFLYATSFLVDPQQYPLSVLIAAQIGQYGNNWPALMSIAVATGLPILVIFLVSYRRLREGLALGSIR
ncbi:MAG: carbohydrate ABC transporter permease [Chloroflexi bacterium]|nr:carbohydrate ABC transporter permease [Chloroflexota bacterium]